MSIGPETREEQSFLDLGGSFSEVLSVPLVQSMEALATTTAEESHLVKAFPGDETHPRFGRKRKMDSILSESFFFERVLKEHCHFDLRL